MVVRRLIRLPKNLLSFTAAHNPFMFDAICATLDLDGKSEIPTAGDSVTFACKGIERRHSHVG